jgi:hypothetical protein
MTGLTRHRLCSLSGVRPEESRSLLSVSPKGACGTLGERPRPRRPHGVHASTPYDVILATSYGGPARRSRETAHGEAQFTPRGAMSRTATEANSRLRSAREWIYRLAGCPRVWSFCPRPPFVRAVARTCTRAVRLCRRCLCPARRLGRLEPDVSADLRIPPSRSEDNRSAPLKWSGMTTKYS